MKKIIYIIISPILITAHSFAEVTENFKNFGENINNNLLTSLGTLLLTSAFVIFIYGLVIFILGRVSDKGDLKELEKGKSFMLWSLVALFVMVSVWGIIKLTQDLLDIKGDNINIKTVSFNIQKSESNKKESSNIEKLGGFMEEKVDNQDIKISTSSSPGLPNKEELVKEEEEQIQEEVYMENDAPPDYIESCGESNSPNGIFTSFIYNLFPIARAQQYCSMKDLSASNQKILKSFINLAIPCPAGTKDLGIVQTEYIPLNKPRIRLCQISSIKGVGRDTKDNQVTNPVFNAVVADKFQKLGVALAKENNGKPFIAISSFRTHGTSFYNPGECKKNPDNCSGDGYSLHQLGVAIDFERKKMPVSTKGDITCKNRAISTSPEYKLINKLAPDIGIKQLSNESWHWDTFPDPNTRCE